VDLAAGTYAATAVLAALYDRVRTGRGADLNISMFDAMLEWMTPLLLMQQMTGGVPEPAGMHHVTITPYGAYRSSDGQLINIAVQNDREWQRLCKHVLGSPELASDPKFCTNARRLTNRQELETIVAKAFADHSADELAATLEAADIPWGSLNDVAGVLTHPQLLATRHPRRVQVPGGTTFSLPDTKIRLSRSSTKRQSTPALGEHTREVLKTLGYSDADIERVVAAGVVGVDNTASTRTATVERSARQARAEKT
jgi:crotonobetainyl-CoA:carnitine CoA-transferase CaiB-like acyl-CoA transferase